VGELRPSSEGGQLRCNLAGCRYERRQELKQQFHVGPVGRRRCGQRCQRRPVGGLDGNPDRPDAGFVLLVRDCVAPGADTGDLLPELLPVGDRVRAFAGQRGLS
jgi:hypothetical protein